MFIYEVNGLKGPNLTGFSVINDLDPSYSKNWRMAMCWFLGSFAALLIFKNLTQYGKNSKSRDGAFGGVFGAFQ